MGIGPDEPGSEHLVLEVDGVVEAAVVRHEAVDDDAVGGRGGGHGGASAGDLAEVQERGVGEAARGERGEVERVGSGGGRDGGLDGEAVEREEVV